MIIFQLNKILWQNQFFSERIPGLITSFVLIFAGFNFTRFRDFKKIAKLNTHDKNALAKFISLCKIILLNLAYVYMIRHVDDLFYESYEESGHIANADLCINNINLLIKINSYCASIN